MSNDSVPDHPLSVYDNYSVHYRKGRTPMEEPLLEVHPHEPVSFEYMHGRPVTSDELNWIFVFKIRDFSETGRVEKDGPHALLQTIYSYDEADELTTIAVNGGTTVPEGVLEAVRQRSEVDGIGRPPYIEERDGSDASDDAGGQ